MKPSHFKRVQRVTTRVALSTIRQVTKPNVIKQFGVRIAVNSDLFSKAMVEAIYSGRYEIQEAEILEQTIAADDRVLEIGAGIGFLACLAARFLNDAEDQLTVVEANPQLIPLIQQNLARNGKGARVMHAILGGDDGGELPFYVVPDFWASSLEPQAGAERVFVPKRSFAGLVDAFSPTYLNVDIEGGEIELLKSEPLRSVKKILLELHPKQSGSLAASQLLASLIDRGFALDFSLSNQQVFFLRR